METSIYRKSDNPVGVYIHLPYCRSRCPYCDYAVVQGTPEETSYLGALEREYDSRRTALENREIVSIYFGGGTPSFAPPSWIAQWVERIEAERGAAVREVTLEANPEDVESGSLEAWADAGVDRLVIGVQSLQQHVLEGLGRVHGPARAVESVERAVDFGAFEVGVDLIFGMARQSVEDWEEDLRRIGGVAELDALFFYEYRPPGGDSAGSGELQSEETGRVEAKFEAGKEAASELGLQRAGVASFDRDGRGGEQMDLYWRGGEYLGIGLGASSRRIPGKSGGSEAVVRRRNTGDIERYLSEPVETAEVTRVPVVEYFADRLALAMRTGRGLSWSTVRGQFESALDEGNLTRGLDVLEWCIHHDFAERRDGRIRPTDRGLDVVDALDREIRSRVAN